MMFLCFDYYSMECSCLFILFFVMCCLYGRVGFSHTSLLVVCFSCFLLEGQACLSIDSHHLDPLLQILGQK